MTLGPRFPDTRSQVPLHPLDFPYTYWVQTLTTHEHWVLATLSRHRKNRVPTKTIWEAVGSWFPALRVQFFARALRARALRALASHGSGLTWLWPHMALAIDHVRVMQRVAGPEA